MNHATITLGEYTIPLIGVEQFGTLEDCDLCHDTFSIQVIELTGTQFLCPHCNSKPKETCKPSK